MSYESELKTILENVIYDKDVPSTLDCIQELNEKWNMKPSTKYMLIDGIGMYSAWKSADDVVIIIGPNNFRVESSKETYYSDLKALNDEYELNKRFGGI